MSHFCVQDIFILYTLQHYTNINSKLYAELFELGNDNLLAIYAKLKYGKNGEIKIYKEQVKREELLKIYMTCVSRDGIPSMLIMKSKDLIIVSYADSQMNHNGYIYQATNWIYTGMTKARTDKYVEGGKHSRHYDNENQNGLRKYRSAKHRYIYFATSKTKRKEYIKKLNYGIEPYPKGENQKYELGTFIEPIIIDTNVAQNSH